VGRDGSQMEPDCDISIDGSLLSAIAWFRSPDELVSSLSRICPNFATYLGQFRCSLRHQDLSTSQCCASRLVQSYKMHEAAEGTGEWLLSNSTFTKWRENHRDVLFWLSGKPGIGKSTLTSKLIERIKADRRKGENIVYYFADAHSADTVKSSSTVLAILWEILAGIISREPNRACRESLKLICIELLQAGDRLSASRMRYLSSKIMHSLKSQETLFLFLDGIDNVEQTQNQPDLVHELIEQLTQSDSAHQVKCFISARRTSGLRTTLIDALNVDLDNEPSVQLDVEIYVRHLFRDLPLSRFGSSSLERLATLLIARAEGLFLWVKLVVESSLRSTDSDALEDILHSPLTKGLSGIYGYMLDRVVEGWRLTARWLLRWSIYASRPLCSSELLDAVYLQLGIKVTAEQIINFSAGLLTVRNSLQEVSLIHLTVKEYLMAESGDKWQAISDESNEMITNTCLKALSPRLLLESLCLSSTPLKGRRIVESRPTIQSYALRNWKFHYQKAEIKSYKLAGLLHSLLDQSLRNPESDQPLTLGRNPLNSLQSKTPEESFSNIVPMTNVTDAALMIGARFNFFKLAKMELEMGAAVNGNSGLFDYTPLTMASRTGSMEIVELLLRHGADVDLPCRDGETAMAYAVSNGHAKIVEILAAHKTKISKIYNNLGSSPNISETVNQQLELDIVLSESCDCCEVLQADILVRSKYPQTIARSREADVKKPQICNITQESQEQKNFPPIQVLGEPIYRTKIHFSDSKTRLPSKLGSGKKQVVKWFSGPKMHRALRVAARHGVEDLTKLLRAAGNDIKIIEKDAGISKLFSKLRIG
jgi:hypothetical protein